MSANRGPSPPQWGSLRFVATNLWCSRHLTVGQNATVPGSGPGDEQLVIRTIKRSDISRFEKLHNELRPGKEISTWRRWLYSRAGSKLVWVVESTAGDFAGFTMYYFREGEWRHGIVHEAFIGVVEQYRGHGLADRLRHCAATDLAAGGVRGISTQIDHDNAPSLRSARRQGFRQIGTDNLGKLRLLRTLGTTSPDRR